MPKYIYAKYTNKEEIKFIASLILGVLDAEMCRAKYSLMIVDMPNN